MPAEIEIKYKLADADAYRRRLEDAGATRRATVREQNQILDTAERRLLQRGCGLRIREVTPHNPQSPASEAVTLTYKGPRDLNPLLIDSGVKAREELEVTVSDADALAALFERLGYESAIVFEKNRETWQYRECVITVDELPQLGWYSEIEGPDAEAVQQVAAKLALTADQHVEETYVELTARYGIPTPTGGRKLEF